MNSEIAKLLQLEEYKIIKIEEEKENEKMIKIITIESKNKKQKCPNCNEYTTSIYDKLKPIKLKYLKVIEQDTKIKIIKKRFICRKCKIKQ